MAEENVNPQPSAEDAIADMLFGADEPVEENDDYEPVPVPQVEGDDSEEATEEATEESDEPDAEFVEVEYDGQLYEVPPQLKEALLRQDDYTRKTQDVAQQRKAIEVGIGQVEMAQQQYQFTSQVLPDILQAQQLESQAEQYHQYLRDNIDSLSATDIEKIRMSIEDTRRERDTLVTDLQQRQSNFQQAQQQSVQELLNKGTEVLRAKIPTWGVEAQGAVRETALSHGFTEAEISSVVDPRQVEVLWKAHQYDTLQAGKAAVVAKVRSAPTIKPKNRNPMPKKVQQDLNLRKQLNSKTMRASDKANLIANSLANSPLFD